MSHIDFYPDSSFPFLVPPLRECLTAQAPCMMGLAPTNSTTYWNEASDYFCFLALPVIVTFALLTELMSIFVLSRHIKHSLDSYLLGMSTFICLLLICTMTLALQHYVGPHFMLVYSQPYVIPCRDWFLYSTIWTLVTMSFERALFLSTSKRSPLCTPVQSAVVVVMVFAVGFVSSLPRFWEYESLEVLDPKINASVLIAQKTLATATKEYNIFYYWYVKGLTLFVPFTIMLISCVIIIICTRPSILRKRYFKQTSITKMTKKIKDETAHSHLLIIFMGLYVFCTTPCITLDLVTHFTPLWADPESRTYASLNNLFTVLFVFQFVLYLILYFYFNKHFRTKFIKQFCCCC